MIIWKKDIISFANFDNVKEVQILLENGKYVVVADAVTLGVCENFDDAKRAVNGIAMSYKIGEKECNPW